MAGYRFLETVQPDGMVRAMSDDTTHPGATGVAQYGEALAQFIAASVSGA